MKIKHEVAFVSHSGSEEGHVCCVHTVAANTET